MTREQADKIIAACDVTDHDWVNVATALARCKLNHLYEELVEDIRPMNLSWWENQEGRTFADVRARIERCVTPSTGA